jgi:hypothetical protein
VKFFKPKDGTRSRIIILPYVIKTKKHPLVAKGRWSAGDTDYVMDIWVHQRFGGGDQDFVCLKKNYNKPCPLCEMAEEYRQQGKEKEYGNAKASRRVFYNVVDARDYKRGVMILGASHYLFERELIEEAVASGSGSEPLDFSDIGNGSVVSFRSSMNTGGMYDFLEFKSFQFESREGRIPKDLLEEIICLDECLNLLTYEEIQEQVYGQGASSDEDDEDERPTRSRTRDKDEDDEDERPTRSRTRDKDEDDEDTPPTRSRTRDKDEDDEDVRKDDSKESKPSDETKGGCPHGHKYPNDWDSTPDCGRCKVWDRCGDDFEAERKRSK